MISRVFDQKEVLISWRQHGDDARDDEGNRLMGQPSMFLEVAHILPHSLTQANANSQLVSNLVQEKSFPWLNDIVGMIPKKPHS